MELVNTAPIDHYLRTLWEHKGSDLLLVAGATPMVRLDGTLRPIGGEEPLTAEAAEAMILTMLGPDLSARLREELELDFSFGWEWQARFRGNAFFQRGSLGLALRLIPREIPTFEELGLPPAGVVVLAVAVAALGASVGSFLGVVLDRVPKGESLGGRSHCVCGAPIMARDNLPIIGYLLRRGRSRCCGARIPIWYFWLEVAGALVALGLLWLVIG